MSRHTTFRFCLDVTVEQEEVLARHVGAARFAFNQCLRLHLQARKGDAPSADDADVTVPWSGFDLINAFNAWKRSEAAGRRFRVDVRGVAELEVTGLVWRGEVVAQVFEEAAVDLGRALKAWTTARAHGNRRAGHPRFKKKGATGSFRIRNRTTRGPTIQVGGDRPRSVTLPKIGTLRVREDTRRLRRMIATGRARVLFATVSRNAAGRWSIALTAEAADLHPKAQHPPRAPGDASGWVGVDRGLTALVVAGTADGAQTLRVERAPWSARSEAARTRRLARSLARKQKGSRNRARAAARLARHHAHLRARRRHLLHQVSGQLVKTHDRLVLEDLHVAGMLANHRLAAAISDAAWAELARQIRYKQAWHGGQVLLADRWFASSKTCSACGKCKDALSLSERTYRCAACGLVIDRDLNAAFNLAAWATRHTSDTAQGAGDRQADGPVTNAHRRDGSGPRASASETSPDDVGTGPQAGHPA
ncbi:RNA-guided endonuclease TnpB family protein [Georgenia thermotolerans]|uniref:IS200/IS605 family element transposase accessory protein TnpB n=1 Tax=Georgenia thermotolerans TaxID=527326 RepID=A0A7J5UP70_9MICO|nr:RNA-guided endonuclease TnpB family protein [Georgenia thermotolerans]KAE8764208.1 IS200/IS605 family element transposase accessory protein TnpB [Georgenia thermotolerans]